MNTLTFIINLKRRKDRRARMQAQIANWPETKWSFVEAVDGSLLKLDDKLARLLVGNDYLAARGVVGCALSHMNLWQRLVDDPTADSYTILEDDATIINWPPPTPLPDTHVTWLGFTSRDTSMASAQFDQEQIRLPADKFVGGTFGYTISKVGAAKILAWIEEYGLRHGIDYIMGKCIDDIVTRCVQPHIVTSPWVNSPQSGDTDIQGCGGRLDPMSFWQFFPKLDVMDHDIDRIVTHSQATIARRAMTDPTITAFNTLGYLKNPTSINLVYSPWIMAGGGVWLRRKFRVHVTGDWCDDVAMVREMEKMMGTHFVNLCFRFVSTHDAEYTLILNRPWTHTPQMTIDPKQTIIAHLEPSVGIKQWGEWAVPDPTNYCAILSPDVSKFTPAFWQLEHVEAGEITGTRHNRIAIILSEKYNDPGHKFRVDLIRFAEARGDPTVQFDVYGRKNYHNLASYRGPVNGAKEHCITPYKYYLAVENNWQDYYVTEKLWEPLLCETMPFYMGCKNIESLLPCSRGLVTLSPNIEQSWLTIKRAIVNDEWSRQLDWIREMKQWILTRHSLFAHVYLIILQQEENVYRSSTR